MVFAVAVELLFRTHLLHLYRRAAATFAINMVIWVCENDTNSRTTLFRKAKSRAAQQGLSLRQLVTEALEEKWSLSARKSRKPWMKHVGKLKDLHRETQRIVGREDSTSDSRRLSGGSQD